MKTGSMLAICLLSLVAIAHLLRLAFDVPITAGNMNIPGWVSIIGTVVPGSIAILLWRERSDANG